MRLRMATTRKEPKDQLDDLFAFSFDFALTSDEKLNHGPDGKKAVQQRIGIFTTEMISIQRDDLVFGQIAFDVVGNN